MADKDKKIQRAAKSLAFFGVTAILSLAFRLWPIFMLAVLMAIVSGIRYACLVNKETTEQADESVCAHQETEKSEKLTKESLQSRITESINALAEDKFSESDWIWEYPDPINRLENGKDVCIFIIGTKGFRKVKVLFSEYNVVALEPFEEPMNESQENGTAPQPADAISVDYGLIAFEWTDAHIMELNGRCNDAIGRGEKELALVPDELPVRESWSALCEELVRVGVHSAECRENGIVIGLS